MVETLKLDKSSVIAFRSLASWANLAVHLEAVSAADWQMHRDTVNRVIRQMGTPRKKVRRQGRPLVTLPMEEIMQQIKGGVPKAEVARRYGVSRPTLYAAIKERERMEELFGKRPNV
jgi:DNA invertase Pin-like site-specific DNA recombinase